MYKKDQKKYLLYFQWQLQSKPSSTCACKNATMLAAQYPLGRRKKMSRDSNPSILTIEEAMNTQTWNWNITWGHVQQLFYMLHRKKRNGPFPQFPQSPPSVFQGLTATPKNDVFQSYHPMPMTSSPIQFKPTNSVWMHSKSWWFLRNKLQGFWGELSCLLSKKMLWGNFARESIKNSQAFISLDVFIEVLVGITGIGGIDWCWHLVLLPMVALHAQHHRHVWVQM